MLDIKMIRNNKDQVIELLNRRNSDFTADINRVVELDVKRRDLLVQVEELKAKRNETSKMIGQYKREGKDVSEILAQTNKYGEDIKAFDVQVTEIDAEIRNILLNTPNVPRETIPLGLDDSENVEIRKVGDVPIFDFEVKPHWDIVEPLDIIDFERAAKISGSRFVVYKGLGARLERALLAFMMDVQSIEHGYTEIMAPYIVKRESMEGTGQLPKFEDDAYKLVDTDQFLIPTSEVSTINLHRGEMLNSNDLPIRYCSLSPCFRKEAGSAGRDTRGIIRQHQFHKVELIQFVEQEKSEEVLLKMVGHAEKILQLLEIPYRVVELCTGDLGFGMQHTYDLEVWLPSQNEYKEVASGSNAGDYQARRANISYKVDGKGKAKFVHTLNCSGVATPRLYAAIIENNQQADGTVKIPKALQPYMGNIEYIK